MKKIQRTYEGISALFSCKKAIDNIEALFDIYRVKITKLKTPHDFIIKYRVEVWYK